MLKAKRDGKQSMIDGVYAMMPYVSGVYGSDEDKKLAELPSLVECNGYFINCQQMDVWLDSMIRRGKTRVIRWSGR